MGSANTTITGTAMTKDAGDGLRLAALDTDDLEVISAHAQDAVLSVGDMTYRARANSFIVLVNRFDWSEAQDATTHRRRRTALHFDRVRTVKARGVSPGDRAKVLNLLAIRFEPGSQEPAGTIELVFSGDATMRLEVECIEARMTDLGPVWAAASKPHHD